MSRSSLAFALWTLLAGAGIPLIGPLNSGLARSLGNPISATAVMFGVAFVVAVALAVPLHGLPSIGQLRSAPASSYAAGLLIGFYALSATIIIPRLGAGSFVAFILIAQIVTAVIIDQYGLFGIARRPIDALRIGGVLMVVGGIVLVQLAARKPT